MDLVVLGSDAMYARPGGATAGYLVREDGFNLWVDVGSGTLANAQRHLDLDDVGAVLISHRHPDHLVDMFPFFYFRQYGRETPAPATPLFGPPGVFDTMRGLLSGDAASEFATSFDFVEVDPGKDIEAGPFAIQTAPMAHPVPTLGLRVEAAGAVLAYTADTGPTDHLAGLAEGAGILLAEATWQDDGGTHPPDLHLTAADAGRAAASAGARRLILTHIKPGLDRDRSRREAAETFGGDVVVAEEGLTEEVGP